MKRLMTMVVLVVLVMGATKAEARGFMDHYFGRGFSSGYGCGYGHYGRSGSTGRIIAIGNIGLGVYEATLQAQATKEALEIAKREQDLRYRANQQQQSYVSQDCVNQRLRDEVRRLELQNEKLQQELYQMKLELEKMKLEQQIRQQQDARAKN